MQEFWQTLLSHLNNNYQVFLAFVVANTKGSPGTKGAKMLISQTGEIFGTIGGGIMEFNLIERAKQILQQSNFMPQLQTLYHSRSAAGEQSGMICAGSQTNLYYLCHPHKDREIIATITKSLEQNIPITLLINASGISINIKENYHKLPQFQLSYQAQAWVYEEQLLNYKRIAIIGGGHCSLALSRVMQQLGYDVLVFETRQRIETIKKNVYAQVIQIVNNYQEVGALIPFPELTFVVVMTTDFQSDFQGLLGVISQPFPFIGVMGSQAKIAHIFAQLRQEGVTEKNLSRLYAPIGLLIGSHTPEEIAISVAAQIIQKRSSLDFFTDSL